MPYHATPVLPAGHERIDINNPEDVRQTARDLKCTTEELLESVAMRGNLLADVRSHLEQVYRSKSAAKRVFYIIGLSGLCLLLLSALINTLIGHYHAHIPAIVIGISHIISEFCRDLGIAFLTAVAVAKAFDVIYHKRMFIEPLNDTYAKVQRSYENIEKTNDALKTQNDDLKKQLVDFNSILKTAQAEGISDIYRRDVRTEESNLRADIEAAIAKADRFLYIQGQTFRRLLVQGNDDEQFGIDAVSYRLRDQPDLRVKICLSNTFDKNSHARLGLSRTEEAGSRQSVLDILGAIQSMSKSNTYKIGLRLTAENPMYGILLTEDCLFLEHYTPNNSNSTILVFKALSDKSLPKQGGSQRAKRLHEAYSNIFDAAYRDPSARRCSEVLEEYLTRKHKDMAEPGHESSERERLLIAEVATRLSTAQQVDEREG